MPWWHKGGVEVSSYSYLTSALDGAALSTEEMQTKLIYICEETCIEVQTDHKSVSNNAVMAPES
jgi:hypothetical protein